jgi:DNA polymerase V
LQYGEYCPDYDGRLSIDWYGRLHPAHSTGTIRLPAATNSASRITGRILQDVGKKSDHRILFRRIGICACDVTNDEGMYQLDLFTDYDALNKEKQLYAALLKVRTRYGANAVFKGMNLLEGATAIERNQQIGGHKA